MQIKVLSAAVFQAESAAQVADSEQIVSAKKLSNALESLPEEVGRINIVTEQSEQFAKVAALCWERYALAMRALDNEVERQRKMKDRSTGTITRHNLPHAI